MYKLMIVEDEPLIRTGLQHYFDWSSLGVNEIVEASNGREGMEVALEERPDLIITDIRMPEMDGLEMIESLRNDLPDALFVILTGHHDFAYAQKAIRLGNVQDYLNKPLQYEESLATITACMEILSSRVEQRKGLAELESEVRELSSGQWVKHLSEGDMPIPDRLPPYLEDRYADNWVGIPLVMSCIPDTPFTFVPSSWQLESRRLTKELASLAGIPLEQAEVLVYAQRSKLYAVVLMDIRDLPATIYCSNEQGNLILHQAGAKLECWYYMAIGSPASEWTELRQSLQAADKTLYQRFFQPDSHLFQPVAAKSEVSLPPHRDAAIQANKDCKTQLLTLLEQGNESQTQEWLSRLGAHSVKNGAASSLDQWLVLIQDLVSAGLHFAYLHDITVEGVYSDKLLTLSFLDSFRQSEDLFNWLAGWIIHLHLIYRSVEKSAQPQESIIFEQIEAFVREHMEHDLSLQMVAERFFYNPSYLSRLFKTKLNKNYMTFVTEIRVGYAQKYLLDPERLVTDVCNLCGYKSYKHFVKIFRSVTGMTPTDYRKQAGV